MIEHDLIIIVLSLVKLNIFTFLNIYAALLGDVLSSEDASLIEDYASPNKIDGMQFSPHLLSSFFFYFLYCFVESTS